MRRDWVGPMVGVLGGRSGRSGFGGGGAGGGGGRMPPQVVGTGKGTVKFFNKIGRASCRERVCTVV